MRLLFIIATLGLALFVGPLANAQQTVSFRLCNEAEIDKGDVLFLTLRGERLCWKALTTKELRSSELASFQGTRRFIYLFPDTYAGGKLDFDPIFNVQIKTLRRDNEKNAALTSVELYRKAMVNLCDNRTLSLFRKKMQFSEYSRREISGVDYNNYHEGKTRVPPPALDNFHIYFRDSRGVCRQTNATEFRKLFAISDVEFRDAPRVVAFLNRLFLNPTGVAAVDTVPYSRVAVEIGRANFDGDVTTGSFAVPADDEHLVRINDLSSYLFDGRRRKSIEFKIVEE